MFMISLVIHTYSDALRPMQSCFTSFVLRSTYESPLKW